VFRSTVIVLIATLLLSPLVLGREPRFDPATGRVRVFYLGDAVGSGSPVYKIAMDPRFSTTPVPAMQMYGYLGEADSIPKFQRIYLPRKYSNLIDQQDMIILSDTESTLYTTKHISWFSDAVENDGFGLLQVGGRQTLLGEWAGTTVEMVLPADFLGTVSHEGYPMRPFPTDPESDFAKSLPFKEMPVFLGLIVYQPKQGSTIIMSSTPKNDHVLIYHEYGEGSSMILAPDWAGAWGGPVMQWEYFPDFISNILHLLAGLKIPQDPVLMHSLRVHFADFEISKGMVLSVVDFADKFGANTQNLLDEWGELSTIRADVNALYIDQEYELALEAIQALDDDVQRILQLALQLKDRALVWVYITEVSALTGTSLITGAIVWMLMVRRKLYREVSTTRPKRMDWEQ
jgi:uncharacterized membrane protein